MDPLTLLGRLGSRFLRLRFFLPVLIGTDLLDGADILYKNVNS
jgi:hypothetical protein